MVKTPTRGWNPRWLAYAITTGAANPVEAQNRDDKAHGSALLPFQTWLAERRAIFTAVNGYLHPTDPMSSEDEGKFDAWLLALSRGEDPAVQTPATPAEPELKPLVTTCGAIVFPTTESRARGCGAVATLMTERGPRCPLHARKGKT